MFLNGHHGLGQGLSTGRPGLARGSSQGCISTGHSRGEQCTEGPPDTHSWAPQGSQVSCSPAETYTWKSFRQYLIPRC